MPLVESSQDCTPYNAWPRHPVRESAIAAAICAYPPYRRRCLSVHCQNAALLHALHALAEDLTLSNSVRIHLTDPALVKHLVTDQN